MTAEFGEMSCFPRFPRALLFFYCFSEKDPIFHPQVYYCYAENMFSDACFRFMDAASVKTFFHDFFMRNADENGDEN